MSSGCAAARAYSNIAFIKYWGNRDERLRLPANGSISMNLAGLQTETLVRFEAGIPEDAVRINGEPASEPARQRVSAHLDVIRQLAGTALRAEVTSANNFPTGTGIASSASAFAALTVAGAAALGLQLSEAHLSCLARLGSGSASRSVPGGFVEWHMGEDHGTSFAESIAPAEYWDLVDLVAIVSAEHKAVGSTGGHALAPTSPLQDARLLDAPRRLGRCRSAIHERDFLSLADVVEQDALMMHAVMMTSMPTLIYWLPPTLSIIHHVKRWRSEGLPVCFTIDAGPNVHVLTLARHAPEIDQLLRTLDGVRDVLAAPAGGPAHLIDRVC